MVYSSSMTNFTLITYKQTNKNYV